MLRKLLSFIFPQTIYTISSPINGEIKVITFWGQNKLVVNNHTQSGEYVEDLLGKGLTIITNKMNNQANILILGLGGGSVMKKINRYFQSASTVGVEIDPIMIELGKKYLHLNSAKNLDIINEDAFQFVKNSQAVKFDLIIVNLYIGNRFSPNAEHENFLRQLKNLRKSDGVLFFNRLYFDDFKSKTDDFIKTLRSVFPNIQTHKIISHLLIFAY